ncbi:hypothetical protein [Pseudoroseomonas cervicalis]|uniref:hypothetical protein n=1 Tax=Teichococcus cervicalis TaxID=204525 RepID=UPI00278B1347|nr:hypothetical protein [Pseudoroseomonas cervicalis]MDQ1081418.1 hypothetical protein [Pseudoroseomonas cervicalis]
MTDAYPTDAAVLALIAERREKAAESAAIAATLDAAGHLDNARAFHDADAQATAVANALEALLRFRQETVAGVDMQAAKAGASLPSEPEPEWRAALRHLLFGLPASSVPKEPVRTVECLVRACMAESSELDPDRADALLRQRGMVFRDLKLFVGNRSEYAAKLFRTTRWAVGWSSTLAAAPGARRGLHQRFTVVHKDRAVAIPLCVLRRAGLGRGVSA